MPEAETPKRETKPSKTLYVIPPLRKKRAETPVPRAKKVTAKAPPPEPKAPPEPKQTAGSGSKRYPHVLNEPPKAKASTPPSQYPLHETSEEVNIPNCGAVFAIVTALVVHCIPAASITTQ